MHQAIHLLIANKFVAGEVIGTCLGMVGVLALTQANKVDRQVGPNNLTKSQSFHNQGVKSRLKSDFAKA